jgi:hypothetical protein
VTAPHQVHQNHLSLKVTARALDGLSAIGGITIYGPRDPARRTSLVAFNFAGHDPVSVARALDRAGVESRAGCHCATLAHHALALTPPASCRLSFYLYNTPREVDHAVTAVADIAAGRVAPRYRPPRCGPGFGRADSVRRAPQPPPRAPQAAGRLRARPGSSGHRCRCLSLRFLIRLPQVAMSHQAPAWLWERS